MDRKSRSMGRLFINLVYHKIAPLILPAVLIFIFFARLFYPTNSLFMIPDFGESDVLHLNLPLKHILSESLKRGEWPLWTDSIAGGFPILAEGQIGTFYLPNLLLFKYLPTIVAYNLNLVIAYLLMYFGTYLFLRCLNLSIISSAFGATIFTFSGFISVHLNHFNLIQAASLLPLIFWSYLKLWKKPSFPNSILCAFFVSQQIFSGHFYIVFISLFGIILFLITYSLLAKKITWRRILLFLLSLIIGISFSSIQLLPTIELWQLSARSNGLDFNTVTSFPYPPKHLLTFINPYLFGNPADGTYPPFNTNWGIFWENTAYIGLLPLFLATIAIFFSKEKLVKIFGIMTFVSIFLVLGKYSPFYLVFSFPPFNFFRVPSKFLLLTVFSLSLLSALSLEKLINWSVAKTKSHMQAIARICYKIIILGGIVALFTLIIIDEYRFSYNYPPLTLASFWTRTPETAKFLQDKEGRIVSIGAPHLWNEVFLKKGWQDITPYVYFRNSLYPNYNALFSIPSIDLNTGGLIPKRFAFFSAAITEIEFDEEKKIATLSAAALNALSLSSVKYLISPFQITSAKLTPVYQVSPPEKYNLSAIYVYQNKEALPRAYIAFQTETVSTVEEWYRKIKGMDLSKKTKVLVENEQFSLNNRGEGLAKIVSLGSTEITLQTQSDTDGVLVLTDTNYPRWQAFVDGRETKIETVNLVQKGILLPQGAHQVVFTFNSSSFRNGKMITATSFLIISAALFLYPFLFPRKASDNKLLFEDL